MRKSHTFFFVVAYKKNIMSLREYCIDEDHARRVGKKFKIEGPVSHDFNIVIIPFILMWLLFQQLESQPAQCSFLNDTLTREQLEELARIVNVPQYKNKSNRLLCAEVLRLFSQPGYDQPPSHDVLVSMKGGHFMKTVRDIVRGSSAESHDVTFRAPTQVKSESGCSESSEVSIVKESDALLYQQIWDTVAGSERRPDGFVEGSFPQTAVNYCVDIRSCTRSQLNKADLQGLPLQAYRDLWCQLKGHGNACWPDGVCRAQRPFKGMKSDGIPKDKTTALLKIPGFNEILATGNSGGKSAHYITEYEVGDNLKILNQLVIERADKKRKILMAWSNTLQNLLGTRLNSKYITATNLLPERLDNMPGTGEQPKVKSQSFVSKIKGASKPGEKSALGLVTGAIGMVAAWATGGASLLVGAVGGAAIGTALKPVISAAGVALGTAKGAITSLFKEGKMLSEDEATTALSIIKGEKVEWKGWDELPGPVRGEYKVYMAAAVEAKLAMADMRKILETDAPAHYYAIFAPSLIQPVPLGKYGLVMTSHHAKRVTYEAFL